MLQGKQGRGARLCGVNRRPFGRGCLSRALERAGFELSLVSMSWFCCFEFAWGEQGLPGSTDPSSSPIRVNTHSAPKFQVAQVGASQLTGTE